VLKIIFIVIGIIIVVFLGLVLLLVWALYGEEHTRKQRCPRCGRKAIYIDSEIEKLKWSYADAIHARYKCSEGHIFEKTWRTPYSFDD
jgi:predicted RND superfamily exporter protein